MEEEEDDDSSDGDAVLASSSAAARPDEAAMKPKARSQKKENQKTKAQAGQCPRPPRLSSLQRGA